MGRGVVDYIYIICMVTVDYEGRNCGELKLEGAAWQVRARPELSG